MKKVLNHLVVVFFAALSVVSCLPDAGYSQTALVSASFEYNGAPFDSDSLFYKSNQGAGIGWGTLGFMHKVDTLTWTFEGGMLLSCKKGTLYDPADTFALAKSDSLVYAQDLYRVNAVKDTVNNNSYLVYYQNPDSSKMPEHDVLFLIEENSTCQAQMCLVNNTSYVAYKVAQNFEPGDRLTLTATGFLKGSKTGEASINLADFSVQKDSIVSNWTVFDLTKLGVFDAVDFEVTSTKEEVPAYFCMDYFSATVTVSNGI
ncbi:MAG: DUF4465 domain-containing protein [Bacteroidales bacterium]|nr:DUF4465 domain-containing protein [Bacteroidales bacterium]